MTRKELEIFFFFANERINVDSDQIMGEKEKEQNIINFCNFLPSRL